MAVDVPQTIAQTALCGWLDELGGTAAELRHQLLALGGDNGVPSMSLQDEFVIDGAEKLRCLQHSTTGYGIDAVRLEITGIQKLLCAGAGEVDPVILVTLICELVSG